jgi:CPA1 family monovalent cation:H+ antiporter
VLAGAALARRLSVPAPLLLTVLGGFASAFVDVPLDEELILVVILPPLLYAAAIRTSLLDFRTHIRPIGLLSIGLVVFTTVGVGLLLSWLMPGLPPAAGFALGAVVAPPDAVAAGAIARRVGMPRRQVTILEGESLVNDATALVLLRTSIAALAGAVTAGQIALGFVVSAGGGLVVGLAVAFVMKRIRIRVSEPVTDAALSLLTPFVAFILAEQIHASGVLAVVITGLVMGHVSPVIQSAQSRLFSGTIWTTVQAVLEDTVFLLIGLQFVPILRDLGDSGLSIARLSGLSLAVLVAVIVLRPIWIFPATYLTRLVPRVARNDPAPPWTTPALLSWAGMRGVVTLAAALTLPPETPYRQVLVLFALVVTGGTLLVQGASLPWLVRRLRLSGADPAEDVLAEAELMQRVVGVGVVALEEQSRQADYDPDVVRSLRERSLVRANSAWELLGDRSRSSPSRQQGELMLVMVSAERREVLAARDAGSVPHEVIQRVLARLDIEEALVAVNLARELPSRAGELTAAAGPVCDHLQQARHSPLPQSSDGCQGCLSEGGSWLHLRMCLQCGYVGCCDSSPGMHASAHYHHDGHPVMRSLEQGEAWRWCFVHDQLG